MNLPIITRLHQKIAILHHKDAIKNISTNPHIKMKVYNPRLAAMLDQIESLENKAETKSPGAKAKFEQRKIDELQAANADLRAQISAKSPAPAPSAAKPSPPAPKAVASTPAAAPTAPSILAEFEALPPGGSKVAFFQTHRTEIKAAAHQKSLAEGAAGRAASVQNLRSRFPKKTAR